MTLFTSEGPVKTGEYDIKPYKFKELKSRMKNNINKLKEKTKHPEFNGITFCKRCLMPNTRPWGQFKDGLCGACRHHDYKKTVDWEGREDQFREILDSTILGAKQYDVLVPMSGGKDGSYVAYTLKNRYGLRVLGATLSPPIWTDIGLRNLKRFSRYTGIPNVLITPPHEEYCAINLKGLVELGYPKRGFVAGLVPSMIQVAKAYDVPLIVWGEHEEEYEGFRDGVHSHDMLIRWEDFLHSDDFCGIEPMDFLGDIRGDTSFWQVTSKDFEGIDQMYWSRVEPWNSDKHLEIACNKCGMKTTRMPGAAYSGGQLDDAMYTFFMYMAFIKFGFGRIANDVGIVVRQGQMRKWQALNLLEVYESELPKQTFDDAKYYFGFTGLGMMWETMHQHWNDKILDLNTNEWFNGRYTWKPEYQELRKEIANA